MTVYLVSKTTKEHFLARGFCAADANDGDLTLVEADADGWIEWHGGKCPLPDNQRCEVKLGYAKKISQEGAMPASRWHWTRGSLSRAADIFAYRPILEDKPQVLEWRGPQDGLPPVGVECESMLTGVKYRKGYLTYASDQLIVWKDAESGQETSTRPEHRTFRPIRTDREEWVEAAAKEFHSNCVVDYSGQPFLDGLEAIYDAGLARMPGE